MTSRELVLATLEGKSVKRTPWVPFVGCHGGSLIGTTASDYLTDARNMIEGARESVKRYKPDGLPVMFDLQVEAEALGCALQWADENPPAVVSHPLDDGSLTLDGLELPSKTDGRIPIALETAGRMRAEFPDLALYGLITGPLTLTLHLLGTGVFMKMFDDADTVKRVLDFSNEVAKQMAAWYIEQGCDVIAVVDPMTSQIGPDHFEQFASEPVTDLFNHVRSQGAKSSFFVCGFAQQNIEVMADCRPDNISIDENIPLDYVRDICVPRGISFGGNLQLTVVLLMGSPDDAKRNAVGCIDMGGKDGFILAPGCDLPYATPPKNLEAVAAIVHDKYERDIARTLAATAAPSDLPELPDFENRDDVTIDVITLDAASCAPCQYMLEAVKKASAGFGGQVRYREQSIKNQDGLKMMMALGVQNLPTICIDGETAFVSRIPPTDDIRGAIQKCLDTKNRVN